ncbi:MAG: VOC family protein [Chloroflexota bacterium]
MRANGYQVGQTPSTQEWGNRSIYFRDPDGNLINFYSRVPGAGDDNTVRRFCPLHAPFLGIESGVGELGRSPTVTRHYPWLHWLVPRSEFCGLHRLGRTPHIPAAWRDVNAARRHDLLGLSDGPKHGCAITRGIVATFGVALGPKTLYIR